MLDEAWDNITTNDLFDEMYERQEKALDPPVHNKYMREIKPGVWVDIYDILVAWKVTNPADAHAIKKMLMPGERGAKNSIQDRQEAIQSLKRAIELENERNQHSVEKCSKV